MASIDKGSVKLGFWIGVGFLLLGMVLMLFRFLLGKVTGGLGG
jgi:hypothetical protein